MFRHLLIVFTSLFLCVCVPAQAESLKVRKAANGTALLEAPYASATTIALLPVGTIVSKLSLHDSFVRVTVPLPDRSLTGYVYAPHLTHAKYSDPQPRQIQALLRSLGVSKDKPDGQIGPRTRRALQQYAQQHGLPQSVEPGAPIYNHMLLELDKKYAPIRQRKLARQRGDALYRKGDCQAFGALDYDARNGRDQAQCEQAAMARQAQEAFDQAIAAGDCDRATVLNQKLRDPETYALQKCRETQAQAAATRDLAAALSALDCARVASLQRQLGKTGLDRECRIRTAETASSAQQLYMAAGLFDVEDDVDAALRLYKQVIQRFPDDARAIDALNRMTALRDRAEARKQAERQSREIEALRKEAEAARRAANQQRQQPSQQATTRRSSACDHLAVGQALRYYGSSKNGAGVFWQWGQMGTSFRVEGLNRNTGVAHLRSLETGRYLDVRCQDLGR